MPIPLLIVLAALASVPLAATLLARRPRLAPLFALVPFGLFLAVLAAPRGVSEIAWIPSLGIAAAFHADGLALLFAGLITGIGTLIFLYASAYMQGDPMLHRFFAVLALFMAAMLGAVLADDLVLLFLFWEMTSLASFLLIGYKSEEEKARKSAVQGLLVTVGGGLALLAGILLLGQIAGSYRISDILERADIVLADPLAGPILILIAIGAFSKSAQWPLHMWLPNAMAAPTPVSAYLHSATMVKLGVYLLARLDPLFGSTALWQDLLVVVGGLTMLTGGLLALRETDLKRVLAWSTVASLGTLVMLIGLDDPLGAKAMVVFLLGHALYKAALFLVAGIIDHESGTREATALGGLALACRSLPLRRRWRPCPWPGCRRCSVSSPKRCSTKPPSPCPGCWWRWRWPPARRWWWWRRSWRHGPSSAACGRRLPNRTIRLLPCLSARCCLGRLALFSVLLLG